MNLKFTDIHHHLLYGLDDGAKNKETMYQMLEKAAADGIGRIVATPHVTPGVNSFDSEQYEKALAEAREYCAEKQLDIEIYPGAEILYTEQTGRHLVDEALPTMAGTHFVLVEFSPDVKYEVLKDALFQLFSNGYTPIIAHIERYACLVNHPSRARQLKQEVDVLFQVNCSTIIDGKGFFLTRFIDQMLRLQLIDAVASDAHGLNIRVVRMKKAWSILKYKCGAAYARKLLSGWMLKQETAAEGE